MEEPIVVKVDGVPVPLTISRTASDLDLHGRDENSSSAVHPVGVVHARSTTEVRAALAHARKQNTPVIPWGTGTSADGWIVPRGDELTIDVSGMDQVLEVSVEDLTARVQPGVTRMALDRALRSTGLFFPVDPGADASLGGMASTNASGTTTVRYGGMRANVLSVELVLIDGRLLRLGRAVRKTSSGYPLKDLVIGSGGTLGVITELTLRLHPRPEALHGVRAFFPDLASATAGAALAMRSGLPLARLELVDSLAISAIRDHLSIDLPELPALFLEFHSSSKEGLLAEQELAREILDQAGCVEVQGARSAEELRLQWQARHEIWYALIARFPGRTYASTDTAVPTSKVTDLVDGLHRLIAKHGLDAAVFGHVADGNVHSVVAYSPRQAEALARYREELVALALDLGGTCTGEHGIGTVKRPYLVAEHGSDVVELMRSIKAVFDPLGLMNPDKIFPLHGELPEQQIP